MGTEKQSVNQISLVVVLGVAVVVDSSS